MSEVQVLLPRMGESIAEATITKWLKSAGDKVEADESIVEIATDKVDSEVPSPYSGVIVKLLIREGEVAKVGQAIAVISSEITAPPIPTSFPSEKANQGNEILKPASTGKEPAKPEFISAGSHTTSQTEKFSTSGKFYSPLVKNIAKQEGITLQELESMTGSGKDGRVTKEDILSYLQKGKNVTEPLKKAESVTPALPPISSENLTHSSGLVEILEMNRAQKIMCDHMVMSKRTSPHVTSVVEADVSNMVKWRDKAKIVYEKREGEKLTFTPVFIEAVVKALNDFPMVNVSLDGYKIIRKKYINIGMATALPGGNLIVPVIRNAGNLNLVGLTKKVNDLAERARSGKLNPDEIQDGTFTITNIGTFGNIMGAPVINQPQVAILAVGAIRKKPAVIETPMGDTIGIRSMMFLSLSYDHRIVDGALGGSFLKRVADYLEKFDINREI